MLLPVVKKRNEHRKGREEKKKGYKRKERSGCHELTCLAVREQKCNALSECSGSQLKDRGPNSACF